MASVDLAVRDELADMLKGGGFALAGFTMYQVARNYGDNVFSEGICAAISAYTIFNELLFLWFFNRIFKRYKGMMRTLRRQLIARTIIFGGVVFYSIPIFVGPEIRPWFYASNFLIKLTVGSPFMATLKWKTSEEAAAFLNFTLAVAYGIMTYQSFQK